MSADPHGAEQLEPVDHAVALGGSDEPADVPTDIPAGEAGTTGDPQVPGTPPANPEGYHRTRRVPVTVSGTPDTDN